MAGSRKPGGKAAWHGRARVMAAVVASALAFIASGLLPGSGEAALAAHDAVAPDEGPGPRVDTVAVRRSELGVARQWDGVVQAVRQSTITAQAQARIVRLDVQAGEHLRKGQVLAVLDARESTAGLAQAEARVAQAQANLANAQVAHGRSEQLYAQGFISKAALDASAAQLRVADAARREAGAGQALQRVAGTYTTIAAPFDGVVSERSAELGEIAAPGRPLLTIYEPGRMRISIMVPAAVAGSLGDKGALRVRLLASDGEARWSAPLRAQVMPAADPTSATVEVRAELPREDARLVVPGQHLAVQTEGDARPMISVPVGSTFVRGELQAAYVASAEGGFSLRAIRLGRVADGRVEVLAGLREGERVAVDPVRAGLRDARAGAGR